MGAGRTHAPVALHGLPTVCAPRMVLGSGCSLLQPAARCGRCRRCNPSTASLFWETMRAPSPSCAVHRLEGHTGGIEALNSLLQQQGFLFNTEGGLTKVGGCLW